MKYKLKLKENNTQLTESDYFRSEYSLTQKNARNLIKYLYEQYKMTCNEQFKDWAKLVTGFVGGTYGRNIVRGYRIGKSIYKVLKRK